MGRLAQWVMGGTHSDVTVGQDTAGKPPACPAGDERVWDRGRAPEGAGRRARPAAARGEWAPPLPAPRRTNDPRTECEAATRYPRCAMMA